MKIKNCAILNITIFCLPLVITSIYKFIESSIGPIVLFYSIAGGILIGFIWMKTIKKKWHNICGIVVGVPVGIVGIILLINFFVFITSIMGEMDYQLL